MLTTYILGGCVFWVLGFSLKICVIAQQPTRLKSPQILPIDSRFFVDMDQVLDSPGVMVIFVNLPVSPFQQPPSGLV